MVASITATKKPLTNRSAELVKELREKLLSEYNPKDDLYDFEDIQRVQEDDWFVKRFLISKGRNVDAALSMVKNSLALRKEFKVCHMKDYEFPLEFYKSGGLFPYETDRKGNVTLYLRVRYHRKISELEIPVKAFILHVFDKVDRATKGQFAVIFDMTDAGYENVDWDFLKFLVFNVRNCCPVGLQYILVCNLHWMLNALRKFAFTFIPSDFQKMIQFASGEEIFDFISKENLPDFLGGTCKRNYMCVPKGTKPIIELCEQYGHAREVVHKHMPHFQKLLDESDRKLASGHFIDPVDYFDEPPEQEQPTINQQLLRVEPQSTVHFYFDAFENCFIAQIIIHNISDGFVAFKVQSNSPKNYCVSPRLAILLPKTVIDLKVQLLPGLESSVRSGKFLILAAPVDSDKMSFQEFQKLWQQPKENLFSLKLCSDISEENENDNEDPFESLKSDFVKLKTKYEKLRRRQQLIFAIITVLISMFLILGFVYFYECNFDQRFSDIIAKSRLINQLKLVRS
ncbi:Motile sperm domain-containing protein 2-like protein [Leptotrombidium deliense]|uniref:Motile sperm domain-containing protein 2-like protein n=1 Tax=Leptotrombidium deliense TaxID=299467 RepID=A0A443SRS4_9ACAR|nr:Motile sperm domain-containing protein 2-like protein [Leptotrombidium deliense]